MIHFCHLVSVLFVICNERVMAWLVNIKAAQKFLITFFRSNLNNGDTVSALSPGILPLLINGQSHYHCILLVFLFTHVEFLFLLQE